MIRFRETRMIDDAVGARVRVEAGTLLDPAGIEPGCLQSCLETNAAEPVDTDAGLDLYIGLADAPPPPPEEQTSAPQPADDDLDPVPDKPKGKTKGKKNQPRPKPAEPFDETTEPEPAKPADDLE